MNNKRRIAGVLALVFVVLVFAGCSGKRTRDTSAESVQDGYEGDTAEETAAENQMDREDDSQSLNADRGGNAILKNTGSFEAYNSILAKRKVIFNGNVTVEVEDFDETYGKINSFISGIGFLQSSQVTKDKVERKDKIYTVKRGVIVIRVAREKFHEVFSNVKSLGDVIEETTGTQDVTSQYFDIESRLKILRIEEERLLDYLEKITDPETIFKYEKRLTQIRQEIESYTGTLRKWDDLVDLSTITINLREKEPEYVKDIEDGKPYGQRLADAFKSSLEGVVNFVGDFIAVIAQAIPVLVLLAIFGSAVYFPVNAVLKRHKKKKNEIQK